MAVVVGGGELDERAELGFSVLPATAPKVGDPERFANRRLLRLALLGLLERTARLLRVTTAQRSLALMEEVVGLRHLSSDSTRTVKTPSAASGARGTRGLAAAAAASAGARGRATEAPVGC